MLVRIKKKYIFDWILVIGLGFYTLVGHWIWSGRGIQESVLICFSVLIISKNISGLKINKNFLKVLLLEFCLSMVVLIGAWHRVSHEYVYSDMKYMCGSILVALAFVMSIKKLGEGYNILYILLKFLNIYFFINNLIIVIQYFVPYFLMNAEAISSVENSAYFDQLTGFLGINGTTRWTIVSVLLLVLNFYIGYRTNNKKIIRYNIFLLFESFIISIMNSARTFLIVAPLTTAIYLFLVKKVKINARFKQLGMVIIICLVVFCLYLSNTFVNNFINNLISDKVAIYFSGDIDYMIYANDDRIKATVYAIENGGMFGTGIGSVPMHSSNSFTKYLGINSASSYIYMIGGSGYLLLTLLLAIFGGVYEKKDNKMFVYSLYLLVLSYFLPIYSSFIMLPAIFLIFYIFSLENNSSKV